MDQGVYLQVEGRILRFSNLGKVLYPETGFTKRDVVRYYRRVAPFLLPHLRARPITLKRFPEGVSQPPFFEKRCPAHRPSWMRTILQNDILFCAIDDLPSLLWVINLGSLELHPYLSDARLGFRPSTLVFDLDPGAPAALRECAETALSLRRTLEANDLATFPKASGLKGLQLYVPLNSDATFDQTKRFARELAERFERQQPTRIVSRMAKKLRMGKVLIDWSQNDEHKTTVAAYSLRAGNRPSASTPLTWLEIEQLRRNPEKILDCSQPDRVLERLEKLGDLFAPVLELRQTLPSAQLRAA